LSQPSHIHHHAKFETHLAATHHPRQEPIRLPGCLYMLSLTLPPRHLGWFTAIALHAKSLFSTFATPRKGPSIVPKQPTPDAHLLQSHTPPTHLDAPPASTPCSTRTRHHPSVPSTAREIQNVVSTALPTHLIACTGHAPPRNREPAPPSPTIHPHSPPANSPACFPLVVGLPKSPPRQGRKSNRNISPIKTSHSGLEARSKTSCPRPFASTPSHARDTPHRANASLHHNLPHPT
jgi:hypothetical protein